MEESEVSRIDRSVSVALAEFQALRSEIDANIAESDRWVRLSLTIGTFSGAATIAVMPKAPVFAAPICFATCLYLAVAAVLFVISDVRRSRAVGYVRDELAPAVRRLIETDDLFWWHDYSAAKALELKGRGGRFPRFSLWSAIGRDVPAVGAIGVSAGFWVTGLLVERDNPPTSPGFSVALFVLFAVSGLAVIAAVHVLEQVARSTKENSIKRPRVLLGVESA